MRVDSFFDNVCELDLVFNFYKVSEPVELIRGCLNCDAGIRYP